MMNRVFTRREMIMLLILALLLLGLGYFKLVHEPVQEGIHAAENRKAEAETAFMVEAARLEQMRAMEAEIEALKAAGEESNAILPDYDNVENVMVQLNAILAAADQYSLTFEEIAVSEEGLVSRPIRLRFTAGRYDTARRIIDGLYHSYYRCGVSEITVISENDLSNEPVEVAMTITFFERMR